MHQQLNRLSYKNHSVLDYATKFWCLSSRISNIEKAKIYKFIKGLPVSTANKIVQWALSLLKNVIKAVLLYEAYWISINTLTTYLLNEVPINHNGGNNAKVYNRSVLMEIDNLQQEWQRNNAPRNNQNQNQAWNNVHRNYQNQY